MAIRQSHLVVLVLQILAFGVYAASLDDVFAVTMSGPGSCANWHGPTGNGLLDRMFQDMQTMIGNTNSAVERAFGDWEPQLRYLADNLFSLSSGPTGQPPADGSIDAQKLEKLKEWFSDANTELRGEYAQDAGKSVLVCDSTLMEFKSATDDWQNVDGSREPKPGGRGFFTMANKGRFGSNTWAYRFPDGNYMEYDKRKSSPPKSSYPDRPNSPTYCASPQHWALTMWPPQFNDVPLLILCPALFERAIPDTLDLSDAALGTSLNTREAKSFTWMHELFHITHEFKETIDAKKRSAKRTRSGALNVRWPRYKDGFTQGVPNVIGAIDCMYLALYDKAEPIETNIDDIWTTKDPETYTWFAAAYNLWSRGVGQREWSTGAARESDASYSTVTVPQKPRQFAIPTAFFTLNGTRVAAITTPA